MRAASGSTTLGLGSRDETWDAAAARKALHPDDYGKAFFWRDPNGDPETLAAYKLPFASPGGGLHAVWAGVTAAAAAIQGAMGGVSIPSSDVPGVKRKIAAYYRKAAVKYNDDGISPPWQGATSEASMDELRYAVAPLTEIEVRDPSGSGDNTWTMTGYAAVFNQATTLYSSKYLELTESVDPAAFDVVLRTQALSKPDGVVHFNFGHDMNRAVAATDVPAGEPGSLELAADQYGLRFRAKVARDDPDGVAMASKMRTGVVRQASFAFTVAKDEIVTNSEDGGQETEHRTIQEIGTLYDVCATPQGAYSQTSAQLRSYGMQLGFPVGTPAVGGNDVGSDMEGIVETERVLRGIRRAKERYPKR